MDYQASLKHVDLATLKAYLAGDVEWLAHAAEDELDRRRGGWMRDVSGLWTFADEQTAA